MKETSTILILICFALFSLGNGFHVRRSDGSDHSFQPIAAINDNTEISEDPLDNVHGEPLENPNEDHQVHILEIPTEDQNEQENEEEENNDELQLSVTDLNISDVGVDGEEEEPVDQENTDPDEEDNANPIEEDNANPIEEDNANPIEEDNANPIEEDNTNPIEEENTHPVDICNNSNKNYLPNTRNCSLFYDCTNVKDISCPTGMWFDPNYIGDTLCQYPEVICAADNEICDCAEKYPPPPPDPLMEISVQCLKDNRFHLFASQISCGRYFVCHNEMKYRMECRQGLHYNSKTEMCDYPEVVNCRIPDPDCPVEGIKFLPDSTRCEVFYFCVHGYKTKQVCPFYHIWDIRSNSCRRQDEAICHLEQ